MSYQDDPNLNGRTNLNDGETSYTAWIIGGVVALAVILGIFILVGRNDSTDTAATDRPSVTTVPGPASGTGTAGNTTAPAPNSGDTAGRPANGTTGAGGAR